jgi:DNA polymerase delta subunit 4
MPPKRRSAGATAKSHQSTLAFHGTSNKVTKSGARNQNAKKGLTDKVTTKDVQPDVATVNITDAEPTTAEAAIIEQTEQEVAAQQKVSTPEEDEARRITEQRINDYWNKKEKERKAVRVHQQDLTVHEKILREFDISGQYGVSAPHPQHICLHLVCLDVRRSTCADNAIFTAALRWHCPIKTLEARTPSPAAPTY